MTDKVKKIREKVEKGTSIGKKKELVSNPTPNERMSKERFAEACKAACCDRNYRSHHGHTETRDDYFVDGVQWADEHPIKERVIKELEAQVEGMHSCLENLALLEDEIKMYREAIKETTEQIKRLKS